MEGFRRLIVVDCAVMGLEPGEWRRLTLEEANLVGEENGPLSLHNAGLRDALRLAQALNIVPPQVIIYGVQPDHVEWDRPMSAAVARVLPEVVQAILAEVEK